MADPVIDVIKLFCHDARKHDPTVSTVPAETLANHQVNDPARRLRNATAGPPVSPA
jgi:hypothetical protein